MKKLGRPKRPRTRWARHSVTETKIENDGRFLVRYGDGSEYRHASYEEARRCHQGIPYLSGTVYTGVRTKSGEAAERFLDRVRSQRIRRSGDGM